MRPWRKELAGRFERHSITSKALAGNPLGDPAERPLWVYLPPRYLSDPEVRLPVVFVLQGLFGQVDMWWNRPAMRRSFPELLDHHFRSSEAASCLVVFVDAWTRLGGSQFLNSPAVGRYMDYLCDEIVAFVDSRYRTLVGPGHRGLAGHSSGGYGAMVLAMLRPDVFGGFASHAGDIGFEYCYMVDLAQAARVLRDRYGGSYEQFFSDLASREYFGDQDATLLNAYCMAACYSPLSDGSVELPFDPETSRFRPEVWQRWKEWDPLQIAERRAESLAGLRAAWIDSGNRDQYFMDLGAYQLHLLLERLGVEHYFELYDGNHSRAEHRYPAAISYLAERLS